MSITYKTHQDRWTGKAIGYFREDVGFIPLDPANNDYQDFLKWLAEGNTPLPPDEPT